MASLACERGCTKVRVERRREARNAEPGPSRTRGLATISSDYFVSRTAPNSRHEREEQERRKKHQVHCSLHHVGATGAESDGAHQEGQREESYILGFQAQDQWQLEGDRRQHHDGNSKTDACERGANRKIHAALKSIGPGSA